MVGVAQLVEHWVVAPVVEGSSPFTHPIKKPKKGASGSLFLPDPPPCPVHGLLWSKAITIISKMTIKDLRFLDFSA